MIHKILVISCLNLSTAPENGKKLRDVGEPALFSPKTTDFRRKWFPLDKSLLQV